MKTFMIVLRMMLLLIIFQVTSYKVYCQDTQIQEDSVCLSAEDARIIFKDLQLFEFCDSIRLNQSLQIKHYKGVLKTDEQIMIKNEERLSELKKTLSRTELKLKISKRLTSFGIPVSFGAGIIASILIFR